MKGKLNHIILICLLATTAACARSGGSDAAPTSPGVEAPGTDAPSPSPDDGGNDGGADVPAPSAVKPVTTCSDDSAAWHYCVHKYPGNNPNVLYYVHGYTDSHYGWDYGWSEEHMRQMRQLQGRLGANSPTVVVISYAGGFESWLLSADARRLSGPTLATVGHFVGVAMPTIENKFNLKGKRILYGMSMGGFNAAQLCLRQPSLWSKCLIQNAMLTTCKPFQDPTDYLCLAGYIVRANFESSEWQRNDPLVYANQVDAARLPKMFVSAATEDEFGLFPGGESFASILRRRGASVEWHVVQGDHNKFNPEAAYRFIMR